MKAKTLWIFSVVIFTISFSWSVYRDIHYEKHGTSDLRNRVVGARLQKDGKLPYFYKWRKEDGMRYYDWANFDSLKASNITATPFFHNLLYPIAELPQRRISYIWMILEYFFMLLCIISGFCLANNNMQKCAVLITATLFLLTDAWITHIVQGQMYILIPLLCMLFYYFIKQNRGPLYLFLAGLCAIVLVLIRPNAIVFFLPFLLVVKNYSLQTLILFSLPIVILLCLVLGNKNERVFWVEYTAQIREHIKFHQNGNPTIQINEPRPEVDPFEGWSEKGIIEEDKSFHYIPHSECGNVYVFFEKMLNIRMPVWLLNLLSVVLVTFVFIVFLFYGEKSNEFMLRNLAILGFCLYMITDLFSPVLRYQYYTVQWLFPLLLVSGSLVKIDKWLFSLMVVGLSLNTIDTVLLKMEHTIGEYLLLLVLILFILKRKTSLAMLK